MNDATAEYTFKCADFLPSSQTIDLFVDLLTVVSACRLHNQPAIILNLGVKV